MEDKKKKLMSLKDFNSVAQAMNHHDYTQPKQNGIACPNCDEELWDTNPMETLLTMPPQKRIHCTSCVFTGYRMA